MEASLNMFKFIKKSSNMIKNNLLIIPKKNSNQKNFKEKVKETIIGFKMKFRF